MREINVENVIPVMILLFALLGAILFFPVKMESGKTCLFHRIFDGDEENLLNHIPYIDRAHAMLHEYLIPFALLWW